VIQIKILKDNRKKEITVRLDRTILKTLEDVFCKETPSRVFSFLARARRFGKKALRLMVLAGLGLGLAGFAPHKQAENMRRDTLSLKSLTCQQLWYLDAKIRADGGVCPATAREKRAFGSAGRCASQSEDILPMKVRTYLTTLRGVRRAKGCR